MASSAGDRPQYRAAPDTICAGDGRRRSPGAGVRYGRLCNPRTRRRLVCRSDRVSAGRRHGAGPAGAGAERTAGRPVIGDDPAGILWARSPQTAGRGWELFLSPGSRVYRSRRWGGGGGEGPPCPECRNL